MQQSKKLSEIKFPEREKALAQGTALWNETRWLISPEGAKAKKINVAIIGFQLHLGIAGKPLTPCFYDSK